MKKSESLFNYTDYRNYLADRLKSEQAWGAISKLAEAAGCQRSYLSRVLHSHVHLTADQAIGVAEHWQMSDSEKEYFLLLLDLARASRPSLKKFIEKKLTQIRRDHENLSKRLERTPLEMGEKERTYYSAWFWGAVHILTSIPEFQTSRAIAERLSMPLIMVREVLTQLEKFGLVRKDKDRYIHASGSLHINKTSPLVSMHHSNWRMRAIQMSQMPNQENIHYTVVQSMDPKAFQHIKDRILELIDEAAAIADPAPSEEAFCMTCDFFKV